MSQAKLEQTQQQLQDCYEERDALKTEAAASSRLKAEVEAGQTRLAEKDAALAEKTREMAQIQAELKQIRAEAGELAAKLAKAEETCVQLQNTLSERDTRISLLQQVEKAHNELQQSVSDLKARLEEKSQALQEKTDALEDTSSKLVISRDRVSELEADLAKVKESLKQEAARGEEKLETLQNAREDMTNQFKVVADAILKQHGETFSKQNKVQVDEILQPLRDKIVEFQTTLKQDHEKSLQDSAKLSLKLTQLSETSARMNEEAENLTRALKGEAQTQGAWGEMILSTILEKSGLRKGEEYLTQESFNTEEGRMRPDAIVNLPGGQKVVIDSKVSLTAFDTFVNSTDAEEKANALNRHLHSVRAHIDELGKKNYQDVVGSGLDYVIMFVPIEGALAAALQADPELTNAAARTNVAIATPTTLMIALRTISNVWQVERRNQNAEEIADRAGKIYDKFVNFIDDMNKLGSALGKASESYDKALKKLTNGRGNLTGQLEKLKGMGAKATKQIPEAMLENADVEEAAQITSQVTA